MSASHDDGSDKMQKEQIGSANVGVLRSAKRVDDMKRECACRNRRDGKKMAFESPMKLKVLQGHER